MVSKLKCQPAWCSRSCQHWLQDTGSPLLPPHPVSVHWEGFHVANRAEGIEQSMCSF